MTPPPSKHAVTVPLQYPTSLIFVDESGAKASGNRFFVVGAVKLRQPGQFARTLRDIRDRHGFHGELKFAEITRGTLPTYYEVIDRLHESDAHLAACVIDGRVYDPFKGGRPAWRVHAEVAAQLLVGCVNQHELVGVLLDGISTPRGYSLEDTVRGMVNRRLRATSIVSAACLDSRSNDTLQVADLVAGAIAFERRRAAGVSGKPNSHKAKVAARLGAAFGHMELADGRNERVNIATYRGRSPRRPKLEVVEPNPEAG